MDSRFIIFAKHFVLLRSVFNEKIRGYINVTLVLHVRKYRRYR